MYWILFIGIALASWLVQANLKNKFEKYSKIPIDGGLTGRDIAVKMLHDNGIYDVEVVSTSGSLTDHYNPANKTVNLSEDVYDTCSVAAAAVAAHECGHAVQHAHAYAPLKMRSSLVPVISFASNWMMWVLLIGMFTLECVPSNHVVRNHLVRCHDLVQLYYLAGRNRCKPACRQMAERGRRDK